jgi:hypothetical protein
MAMVERESVCMGAALRVGGLVRGNRNSPYILHLDACVCIMPILLTQCCLCTIAAKYLSLSIRKGRLN